MSARLRVGVIGCGNIAYWAHLRVLRRMREAQLIAASDPDPIARESVARLVKIPIFECADDLLARSDIDAVVICAPPHLHHKLALDACAARKHIFMEKPLAMSAEEGRSIVRAVAGAGLVAMMGFNRRFHPVIERARALIAQGRLGKIYAVQSASCQPQPMSTMAEWRKHRASGGGVMLELASHHIDLIPWLIDDQIARAEARIVSELTEADSAWMHLSTVHGVDVTSFFSFRTGLADWIQLVGERGTLTISRSHQTPELRVARRFGYGTRRALAIPRITNFRWRLMCLARPSFDPSRLPVLEAFVALVNGSSREVPTLDDGLRSLEVILAAEESACAGRAISLDGESACVSS